MALEVLSTRYRLFEIIQEMRRHGHMNRTILRIAKLTYVCMYVWMDGWMDGWMVDRWMDGWMDGCMYVCMYVCMYRYIYICPQSINTSVWLWAWASADSGKVPGILRDTFFGFSEELKVPAGSTTGCHKALGIVNWAYIVSMFVCRMFPRKNTLTTNLTNLCQLVGTTMMEVLLELGSPGKNQEFKAC